MPIYKTGKTKDGKAQYRVIVNYTDNNGNHKSISKRVYGSAEAKLEELSLLHQIEKSGDPQNLTVKMLYDEYMAAKATEVRQSSLEKTASILKNHILPYLSDVKIADLTPKKLQNWKNAIAEKDSKITTKNNAYRELNALVNFAIKMEYINSNPLKKVGRFRDAYFTPEQGTLHYYTPEQFREFIAVAEQYKNNSFADNAFYVFFNIAYYTGMRKGEINALTWDDIDGNLVHVRRSISQKTKGGFQETPPKNASSYRTLQMPQKLVDVLEQHRILQKRIKGFSGGFRVCGGASVLSDTNIEIKNTKFSKEAGLPHIRIHDFRHSHASVLANAGINIMEISRRLGHSNVQQTWNTYSHLYPREEERAIEVLNGV
jgi:integrase